VTATAWSSLNDLGTDAGTGGGEGFVASPGFLVSEKAVAYVKAHPTESITFSGTLSPGIKLKNGTHVTAVPDAEGYGYVYLNDRPALVDTGSRTVVWIE